MPQGCCSTPCTILSPSGERIFPRSQFPSVVSHDPARQFLRLVCFRFSHQPLVFKAEGFSRQQLKRLENCAQRDDSRLTMKSQLIAIVAAVVLVGCKSISIHQDVFDGNIEAVKQHLDAGAEVDAKDDKFVGTFLHWAAAGGQNEIVELLITKGADVNARNDDGVTPLDTAIMHKQTEITDLLRQHGGKTGDWLNADDSIHNAASAGHIEAVKQHLAAGADVNAKDSVGWTPLHLAAIYDHKETAELIIANGADVNAKNDGGFTPLHAAALNGHKEIAELLLANGADVNPKDRGRVPAEDTGKTPLHLAAKKGHNEVAELLIAKGADVNKKDDDGKTPLDSAIFAKQTETADLLRKHGGKTGAELKAAGN